MLTVNSDCLADKFEGWLEISISRHRGWLRGSNRRHLLTQAPYYITLSYYFNLTPRPKPSAQRRQLQLLGNPSTWRYCHEGRSYHGSLSGRGNEGCVSWTSWMLVQWRVQVSPDSPEYSHRTAIHCKHPAHSCVVGCKERGGLTYGDSLNSSGNYNNAFVCCAVTVGTTHQDTKYSVNKQTN